MSSARTSPRIPIVLAVLGAVVVAGAAFAVARVWVNPFAPSSLADLEASGFAGPVGPAGLPGVGAPDPKVFLVEVSDFECPYCSKGDTAVREVLGAYGADVRLVFVNDPLPFHDRARPAAIAARAAGGQGRFFAFAESLFDDQARLDDASLDRRVRDLGLDAQRFKAALPEAALAVDADLALAERLGVEGTPTFFLNGRMLEGAHPFEALAAAIEDEIRLVDDAVAGGMSRREAIAGILDTRGEPGRVLAGELLGTR
jgi:predicted DsbA family dithiol-disulfide isomerase